MQLIARRTPVIEGRRTPAGQVHGAHIAGFETGLLQQFGDRTVEIAATGKFFPDRIDAVLPALNTLVGCLAMFAENQFAGGF